MLGILVVRLPLPYPLSLQPKHAGVFQRLGELKEWGGGDVFKSTVK